MDDRGQYRHYRVRSLTTVFLLAVTAPLFTLWARPSGSSVVPDDLAFVAQANDPPDLAEPEVSPGCNTASVVVPGSGDTLYRSRARFPGMDAGGFAATTDLSLVLSPAGNWYGGPGFSHALLALRPALGDWSRWTASWITGDRFAPGKGIAIGPDDDSLFVETLGEPGPDGSIIHPPYSIKRFLLSELGPNQRIGPERGSFALHGPSTQIFPSSDGRRIHVVTGETHQVFTLDAVSLREVATAISLPKFSDIAPELDIPGVITPDERYLILRSGNGEIASQVIVADLDSRRSWPISIPGEPCKYSNGEDRCGELAINYGAENHGLLAIRGAAEVSVFEFNVQGSLRRLGRLPLEAYPEYVFSPVAWTATGSSLIVGARGGNRAEFLVVQVSDGGRQLTPVRWLQTCGARLGDNYPYAIFTHNRKLARVPTVTPTHTPTATPTACPTDTPSASPTATYPSPSRTPTVTSTRSPVPVLLPLLLRESCTPTQRRVDATLVLDASSSMIEPTATGRTKLAAAIDAARAFLAAIHLDAGDQAALVAFNADAWLVTPLTTDHTALDAGLAGITTAQFTRIDRGIAVARDELASPRRRTGNVPVMIVLTDGLNNPVPVDVAVAEAARAKDAGVVMFTVGLGQDVDAPALAAMASRPEYAYLAPDAEALAGIYRTIAVTIPCPAAAFWGRR
jgi:hypothetical protein